MSFDQLMEHASQIQYLATKHALDNKEAEAEYARNGVDGYYAQVIPPLFKPFSQMPDPGHYQPLIDDLRTVLTGLSNGQNNNDVIDAKEFYPANPTLTKMTTASDYMEDWTGVAAMDFKQKFLDPFPAYARNQAIVTSMLKAGLEAHQTMWASARNDIDKIAHAAMDAFDNQGCSNKNTWNVGFTVISSLAAVTATFLTAGGAAAITATIIAATAQVAATTPPADVPDAPKDANGGGETALQMINTLKQAIESLTSVISKAEDRMVTGLGAVTGQINSRHDLFVAARPALADTPPGGVTGDDGLGESQ
jgi:hypothetical protein